MVNEEQFVWVKDRYNEVIGDELERVKAYTCLSDGGVTKSIVINAVKYELIPIIQLRKRERENLDACISTTDKVDSLLIDKSIGAAHGSKLKTSEKPRKANASRLSGDIDKLPTIATKQRNKLAPKRKRLQGKVKKAHINQTGSFKEENISANTQEEANETVNYRPDTLREEAERSREPEDSRKRAKVYSESGDNQKHRGIDNSIATKDCILRSADIEQVKVWLKNKTEILSEFDMRKLTDDIIYDNGAAVKGLDENGNIYELINYPAYLLTKGKKLYTTRRKANSPVVEKEGDHASFVDKMDMLIDALQEREGLEEDFSVTDERHMLETEPVFNDELENIINSVDQIEEDENVPYTSTSLSTLSNSSSDSDGRNKLSSSSNLSRKRKFEESINLDEKVWVRSTYELVGELDTSLLVASRKYSKGFVVSGYDAGGAFYELLKRSAFDLRLQEKEKNPLLNNDYKPETVSNNVCGNSVRRGRKTASQHNVKQKNNKVLLLNNREIVGVDNLRKVIDGEMYYRGKLSGGYDVHGNFYEMVSKEVADWRVARYRQMVWIKNKYEKTEEPPLSYKCLKRDNNGEVVKCEDQSGTIFELITKNALLCRLRRRKLVQVDDSTEYLRQEPSSGVINSMIATSSEFIDKESLRQEPPSSPIHSTGYLTFDTPGTIDLEECKKSMPIISSCDDGDGMPSSSTNSYVFCIMHDICQPNSPGDNVQNLDERQQMLLVEESGLDLDLLDVSSSEELIDGLDEVTKSSSYLKPR